MRNIFNKKNLGMLLLVICVSICFYGKIEKVNAIEKTTYSSWDEAGEAAEYGVDYEIKNDEYIINTALGLAWLSLSIESNNYEDDTVVLAKDIDLLTAGVENYGPDCTGGCNSWIPIGESNKTFNGYFNGNGNIISGVYIDADESYIGLFGYVVNAHIENLGIIESYIEGSKKVGGIVGYAKNTIINNVFNKAEVRAESFSGGIVGAADNTSITDVYSIANVMNSELYAGAIAGELDNSTISNTYSVGFVESEAYIDMVVGNYSNMDAALLYTS